MAGHEQIDRAILAALDKVADALDGVGKGVQSSMGTLRAGAEHRLLQGQSFQVATSPGRLAGYAVRETTGTTGAVIQLLDGRESGELFLPISLAAGESTRDWYMPVGVGFVDGLYLRVVSGAVEGAVFIAPPAT